MKEFIIKLLILYAITSSGSYASESYPINISINCNISGFECHASLSSSSTSINDTFNISIPSNFLLTEIAAIYFASPEVLKFVPTSIFMFVPNLKNFFMIGTSLATLTTHSFNHCDNLNVIQISQNHFETLNAGFAQPCLSLLELLLTYNHIQNVDVNAFDGLINLQVLNLADNEISFLPPDVFSNTPKLSHIVLIRNFLVEIDTLIFANLPMLAYVQLMSNRLASLPAIDLTTTADINIQFDFNSITKIDMNFFTLNQFSAALSRNTTFYVSVAMNPCTTSDDYFSNTKLFQQEDLSICLANWNLPSESECASVKTCRYYVDQFNRYTCVIENADSLITEINGMHLSSFTDNQIKQVIFLNSTLSKIPSKIFEKFPNVQFLSTSNSSLTLVDERTLDVCGQLTYLDLSYNQIMLVSENSFRNCSHLETVNLIGNPIKFLNMNLYRMYPSLKNILLNNIQ